MSRDNKAGIYSYRDSKEIEKDIIKCAEKLDMKKTAFLRYAVNKTIEEVMSDG